MKTPMHQYFHHVSVHSDEGLRVDKTITIERPVSEVYSFWRKLNNLARFMRHVRNVDEHDELHSHWTVETIAGKTVEWDAEIIEQRENEMISWRSAPGADVDNAGSVWFTSIPGGLGTVVQVELKYNPPAGKTGALIAKLFGRDADSEIAEDLGRVKTLLETGELPEGWRKSKLRGVQNLIANAQECVRSHPWQAVACAVAGFCVLGFLISRQRSLPQNLNTAQNLASSLTRLKKWVRPG
jgi:uncharacterized membrane protein